MLDLLTTVVANTHPSWAGPRILDCPKKAGLSLTHERWTTTSTLDSPKNSGLTQEESAGPKNLRVRAAEGRESRPHPNAGLTLSQEREDGSSPEGAGKKPCID
ncbi:hypothetical protein DdX_01535 [Ditylenchus destructor]|uniref:Uncharacterized protein n=1 Tax=Ditylenchus destructor TaxID=166010 RepID=A0AAD4RB99_9BILA|nr:hypothetical protein DdX_01535 [Ditylenchus destructor]